MDEMLDSKRKVLGNLRDMLKAHAAAELADRIGHPVTEEKMTVEPKMAEGGMVDASRMGDKMMEKTADVDSEHLAMGGVVDQAHTPEEEPGDKANDEKNEHLKAIEEHGDHPLFGDFLKGKEKTQKAKTFNKYSDVSDQPNY